ncbi:S49 family peptidase [Saccharophagus degradans]|uniref:S49 family peptidase n=1 Tax=Saccharophagus degradans TaxID=86304 RepID=UPI001C0A013A|nr:S49 family peptidase [Saccharophagus degradans]MBU2984034.1 S49 family peptidase [Saccharophagus degradans]
MLFRNRPSTTGVDPNDEHRDFKLLEAVVVDAFAEQKKARRWGIVFKTLTFAYLFVVLMLFVAGAQQSGVVNVTEDHTAVVMVRGAIAGDKEASAPRINAALRAAFENEHAKAIVLAVNSPGGSPVQSAYVYDEIMRLKKEYPDKKVYAVIEDIGASGAYYISAAADEIYANRSSLVGSIGVIASGFGFTGTMEKLGVERRVYTSGENKAFLDPFSPANEQHEEFWEGVLAEVHVQFMDAVKAGRGDRLKDNDTVFSGLIWNGERALEMGLIDGLGSARDVARDVIKHEKLVDYTRRKSPLQELMNSFGVSVGEGIARSVGIDNSIAPLR